jgi:hypothetical protein
MLHRVALVRLGDSEERSVSIIRVARIGEQGTTLTVNSSRENLKSDIVSFCHATNAQI